MVSSTPTDSSATSSLSPASFYLQPLFTTVYDGHQPLRLEGLIALTKQRQHAAAVFTVVPSLITTENELFIPSF